MTRSTSTVTQKEQKSEQIGYYNIEIANLEMKAKRVKKVFTEGYQTFTEFAKEMNSIKNSITDLKNKISVLNSEINQLNEVDINDIIQSYKDSNDYNFKREFVMKYVNQVYMYKIDAARVDWKNKLYHDEKILYFEMFAFNFKIPLKILMTPYSKNVVVSNNLQLMEDYNIVVDITKKL